MKRILSTTVAILILGLTGCNTTPTQEQFISTVSEVVVYNVAYEVLDRKPEYRVPMTLTSDTLSGIVDAEEIDVFSLLEALQGAIDVDFPPRLSRLFTSLKIIVRDSVVGGVLPPEAEVVVRARVTDVHRGLAQALDDVQ